MLPFTPGNEGAEMPTAWRIRQRILTMMVTKKSKMKRNTHFLKYALRAFLFLINHLVCAPQTAVQNGLWHGYRQWLEDSETGKHCVQYVNLPYSCVVYVCLSLTGDCDSWQSCQPEFHSKSTVQCTNQCTIKMVGILTRSIRNPQIVDEVQNLQITCLFMLSNICSLMCYINLINFSNTNKLRQC